MDSPSRHYWHPMALQSDPVQERILPSQDTLLPLRAPTLFLQQLHHYKQNKEISLGREETLEFEESKYLQ